MKLSPLFCLALAPLTLLPARAQTTEHVVVNTSQQGPSNMITAGDAGNNQLLYFTSPSLTADGRHLVFISDRTGNPNLFTRDLVSGKERQLTTNTDGVLKAYVYFDGNPYRGFGKGSVSLDLKSGTAYYIQGRQIRAVTLEGRQRLLAELPPDQMTAYTHVSADGSRLCVPTTDARALDGDKKLQGKPEWDIDQRVREEGLSSYLRIYDTATGKLIHVEQVPKAWITHVQFSPVDRNLILYNNEWSFESGIRRMRLWDGHKHITLRTEGEGRSRFDNTVHEMWERDGQAIIYHGTYKNGAAYLGRVRPDGSQLSEIELPRGWKRYGHFTVGEPGELVTDCCYETPSDPAKGSGAWISLLRVDWNQRIIQWFPLVLNGSSWDSQDSHPHPVFNQAADSIWFTSDMSGKRAVYQVGVKAR